MCVAIPGRVMEIINNEAIIDIGNIRKKVNIMLVENVIIGDYVLIHGGCAINKISEEEAMETIKIFEELIQEYR